MGYIATKINSLYEEDNKLIINYMDYVILSNRNDWFEDRFILQPNFVNEIIEYIKTIYGEGFYVYTIINNSKTRVDEYKFQNKLKKYDYYLEDKGIYYLFSKEIVDPFKYIFIFGTDLLTKIKNYECNGKYESFNSFLNQFFLLEKDNSKVEIKDKSKKVIEYCKKIINQKKY